MHVDQGAIGKLASSQYMNILHNTLYLDITIVRLNSNFIFLFNSSNPKTRLRYRGIFQAERGQKAGSSPATATLFYDLTVRSLRVYEPPVPIVNNTKSGHFGYLFIAITCGTCNGR